MTSDLDLAIRTLRQARDGGQANLSPEMAKALLRKLETDEVNSKSNRIDTCNAGVLTNASEV